MHAACVCPTCRTLVNAVGQVPPAPRQDSLDASQAESTQRPRDQPATENRGAFDDSRLRRQFRLDSIMASSILPQFKQRTASIRSLVPWGSESCSATTHPLHRTQFIAASLPRYGAGPAYGAVSSDDRRGSSPPVTSDWIHCSLSW